MSVNYISPAFIEHQFLLNNGPCKPEITATDAKSSQCFPSSKFDQKGSTNTDSSSLHEHTHITSHRDDTVAH